MRCRRPWVCRPSRWPERNTATPGKISPRAGQAACSAELINVDQLIAAYCAERPGPTVAAQRLAFGTSGHRGSAFDLAFTEWHVLAITAT